MSDEIDRAQDEQERNIQLARRQLRPAGPVPNGRCHFCDEVVSDTARWCDSDCRDLWEQRNVRG